VITTQNHKKLSALERLKLIQQLSELPLTQFGHIEFALNVPKGIMPGVAAPVGDRARALLDWAEGPTGVGLDAVCEVAQQVIPTLELLKQEAPASESMTVHLVVTLAGNASELELEQLMSLLNELRRISNSELLEILRIEPGGDTRCIIHGPSFALNSLKIQHQLDWLNYLLDRPVLSVEFEPN